MFFPWLMTRWHARPPFFGIGTLRPLGAALVAVGAAVLVDAFRRFAVEGLGTPAPFAPTQTLVVSGPYRFVRNPMYVALLLVVFGQALLFASRALVVYGAVAWALVHTFVVLYEEPKLHATYGERYDAYCARVRRWL